MVGQDAEQVVKTHLTYLGQPPATVEGQVWAAWEYSQAGARVEAKSWLDIVLSQQPNHADAQRLRDGLDATNSTHLDGLLIRSRSWLKTHPQASEASKQMVLDRVEFIQSEQVRIQEVEAKLQIAVWLPLFLTIMFISLASVSIARLKV